ncbi:tetratricopeptide repeat protein [Amycolatopsis sp. A133]|uniref:tetratricopeptide repeat protein n=1 Tax=Amycolatopsis sp. A133 TaxID=3064472 RepID=UPI0037C163E0
MVLHDRPDIAERAWHEVANTGNAEAMNNLGVLLQERDERTEAEEWFRKDLAGRVLKATNDRPCLRSGARRDCRAGQSAPRCRYQHSVSDGLVSGGNVQRTNWAAVLTVR